MRENLIRLAEGALGGVAGTLFMQTGMQAASRLPEAFRPPAVEQDPGDFVVSKAERIGGRRLPERTHRIAAHGLHWAYGLTWPTALALLAPRLGIRSWRGIAAAGAAMGAGVFALGYLGWLPATGLTRPMTRHRAGHVANALASHVVYGVLSAVPIYLFERWIGEVEE